MIFSPVLYWLHRVSGLWSEWASDLWTFRCILESLYLIWHLSLQHLKILLIPLVTWPGWRSWFALSWNCLEPGIARFHLKSESGPQVSREGKTTYSQNSYWNSFRMKPSLGIPHCLAAEFSSASFISFWNKLLVLQLSTRWRSWLVFRGHVVQKPSFMSEYQNSIECIWFSHYEKLRRTEINWENRFMSFTFTHPGHPLSILREMASGISGTILIVILFYFFLSFLLPFAHPLQVCNWISIRKMWLMFIRLLIYTVNVVASYCILFHLFTMQWRKADGFYMLLNV